MVRHCRSRSATTFSFRPETTGCGRCSGGYNSEMTCRVAFLLTAATVVCAASPGDAMGLADPASSASEDPNKPAPVGNDVIESARRWIKGDLGGRSELEALATEGRSDAQEMLGELMGSHGPPALRDELAACGWFVKAAASRLDSLHNSALCAEKGVNGTPDLARAAELYRQAADRGYHKSMCALGNLYVAGRGVPKDEAKGAELCRQAAEQGEPDAQTDLGNLYLRGIGVPHDVAQARHWYELAAAQGQPNATFILGQIYWNGDGVARDQSKAAELWKAAYRGGRDAAPLLATWLFASWMSGHPRGDVTVLNEAIQYQEITVRSVPEANRAKAQTLLTVMQSARATAEKEK